MGEQEALDTKIEQACHGVFSELLDLWPEDLQRVVGEKLYIAGGAIVSLALGEEPCDWDFFVKDALGLDYVNVLFSLPQPDLYELIAKTQNGITLKLKSGAIVQIVTRFLGEPDRVFKSFDFEHCKAFYDPYCGWQKPGPLVYDRGLILAKKLQYSGEDDYPLNTIKRLVKFIRRGWEIDNESIMNLAVKLSKTNLSDPTVRAEQTIGFYGSSMR